MENLFQGLPFWAGSLISGGLIVGSVAAGYLLGRRQRRRHPGGEAGSVGAAAAAILGLLAFLLAFTFGMAASRFDARKALVLDESNAIGTAWLRAELLDGAAAATARKLLTDYLDVRLRSDERQAFESAIAASERIHTHLWTIAADAVRTDSSNWLFATSINEVIDLHTKRVVFGLQYHVPSQVWTTFALVSTMAMIALGYLFGLAGTFHTAVTGALAVAFGATILLIVDIDRPADGFIRVDLQPLRDLREDLAAPRDAATAAPRFSR